MTLPPVAILAGGLATRLRPLTETIPKVLVPVAGKPFLAHQLNYLREQGVTKVVLCVGHMGEMVQKAFGDGQGWDVDIQYSFDGPVLLGTGGAIRQALPLLGEEFFVLYGDSYLPIAFRAVWLHFQASNKQALMTIYRNQNRWDTSNVWYQNGEIRKYSKRDRVPEMHYIDYGLSLFQPSAFQHLSAEEPADLADLMSTLASQGEIVGFEAQNRFYEIGSHAGLAELNRYLEGR